jgi:cation diffusion facilitator family transporter
MMLTTHSQQQNWHAPAHQVDRVLWQVLVANLVVAAAKIATGLLTGSISMVADGFHSATDASSNVIGLIGSRLAARPPDSDHPYGHHKYETFATLGIGLLLLVTSWNILKSVFTRLVEGSAPEVTPVSFAVILVTILINLVVSIYERKKGQQLNSAILQADAAHTRSDIFVSISVLGSLIAVTAGLPWLDAVVALVIVGIIAHTGWGIVRQAGDVLADSAAVDKKTVKKITLGVKGVKSCHKIRSRGSSQARHLDLHIQVDNKMTIEEAHWVGHLAQSRLEDELGIEDVIVHVEPMHFRSKNGVNPA